MNESWLVAAANLERHRNAIPETAKYTNTPLKPHQEGHMSVLRRFDGTEWVQIAGPSNTARYLQGPIGDRPSADDPLIGTFYWATDESVIYYCTGSTWEQIG